jgi:sulfatase maturation enzyme AslB (radical SAM superfamily)
MCHPESSHRVNEDREIISRYRKNLPWSDKILSSQKTVSGLIERGADFFNQLTVVQYSGGEPLISDEQLDFTQTILKYKPENIHLRYATNLTHLSYKNVSYPEIWKHFKKVNVKVSIDGLDDVYNYIRVGSQFEKIVSNIKKLQDFNLPNLSLSIGFTTQAYNLYQLPEFLDYFEKIIPRQAITTHLLHSPKMMMIDVYPEEIRKKLIRKIETRVDLAPMVSLLKKTPPNEKYWKSLCLYTKEMENKYSIESGFHFLLQKYLADY